MALRMARIRVSGKDSPVFIPISSAEKPPVSEETAGKWKKIINLMAGILHVPAGLIMRFDEENIEVFLKSEQKSNPYEENEKASLLSGSKRWA